MSPLIVSWQGRVPARINSCILFLCILSFISLDAFRIGNTRYVNHYNQVGGTSHGRRHKLRIANQRVEEGTSSADVINEAKEQKYRNDMVKKNIYYEDMSMSDQEEGYSDDASGEYDDEDSDEYDDDEDADLDDPLLLKSLRQKALSKNDQEWMFFDVAKVNVQGGEGGDGCMAMRREFRLEFGGPCGGNGGHGGNVYIECDETLNTLALLRRKVHHKGKDGTNGLGNSTLPPFTRMSFYGLCMTSLA